MHSIRCTFAVSMAASVLVGCRHAPSHVASAGTASYQFIAPPPAAGAAASAAEPDDTGPMTIIAAPTPIEPLRRPVYPPRALIAKAGAATVAVRLTIDEKGQVTDVEPSLLALTTPGRWEAQFNAAVEAAVRDWQFYPAQRQWVQRRKLRDGSDSLFVRRSENVESTVDVAFTFNALGDVVSDFAQR